MQQKSAEWFAARCGKVTASRVADVVARTKSGYAASRANYMAELVCETLTGQPAEGFTSAAMQRGIDLEPAARDAYSARTGHLVEEVGFIVHPTIPLSGASPDGVVNDGLVEIKVPNTATHIEYLLTKEPPQKYFYQMQWQMACAEKKWCDWVSYDDRMPQHLQLLVVRIPRDDQVISVLEREVVDFLAEMLEKVDKLKELKL